MQKKRGGGNEGEKKERLTKIFISTKIEGDGGCLFIYHIYIYLHLDACSTRYKAPEAGKGAK